MSDHPRAFISYARKDGEETAKELFEWLENEEQGISLWWDRARMEGGKGWWNQIQDAIDQAEFLILVMTEGALQSETTRKEWQYARQHGVCVYPVIPEGFKVDFERLPNWMRSAHFFDLGRERLSLLQHLRSPCYATSVPFMVPDLPRNLVVRPQETRQLLEQVVTGSGEGKAVSLCGAGGFGKTTLAAALCHDHQVIETFYDGILWVELGVDPDLRKALATLYRALTGERIELYLTLEGVTNLLSDRLLDKICLLVIDDVWSGADLKPLLQAGKNCTRLITTRRFDLASQHSVVIRVDEMTPSESVEMLTDRLVTGDTDLEPFRSLAHRLGECPLALELVNAALRQRTARGSSLEDALGHVKSALDQRGVTAFDRPKPKERNEALEKTIAVSLEFLAKDERLLLFQLATFPEDISAPRSAVQALWQMRRLETDELLMKLDDLALVKYHLGSLPVWPPKGAGWLKLHDVLRDFYARKLTAVANLQERLRLLTDAMPLNGFADRDFFSYHRCALDLCSQIPVTLLPEKPWEQLVKCWDQFVTEDESPDLWNTINRIDPASLEAGGIRRMLGKFDLGQSDRGLFLADSGVRLGREADPTCIVKDFVPDAATKLWQNIILFTNTTRIKHLCLIEYFNDEGCVMLRFLLSFPGRSCRALNAFDSIVPGTSLRTFQRFFGEDRAEPFWPIPVAAFGDGRMLISIKALRDDPQSLLTLPSELDLQTIEAHYASQAASTETTTQKIVRINNVAVGQCAQEDFDSAESHLNGALQLAETSGLDGYASVIRLNLLRGPSHWKGLD